MGGTDEPENLIELTISEHAEAHKKLYEEHGNEYDRIAWQTLSGQITNAEATKEAQRECGRIQGKINFLGKTHTPEVRKRISEAQKVNMLGTKRALGHKKSDECKQILREKRKLQAPPALGHKHTEESKVKMSEAKSGNNNPMFGRDVSEETRKKLSNSMKGNTNGTHKALDWIITDPDGKTFQITNLSKFCREHKLSRSNMMQKGKSKGYQCWKLSDVPGTTHFTSDDLKKYFTHPLIELDTCALGGTQKGDSIQVSIPSTGPIKVKMIK